MLDLSQTAQQYVNGSKTRWENLVNLTFGVTLLQLPKAAKRLAQMTGESETSVAHRMKAVRFAMAQGATPCEIRAMPQRQVVADYIKGKRKARGLPLVSFPHRLTKPVRDDLEEQVLRLAKVLRLRTYDEVFEFIVSQLAIATDEELIQAAGGENNAQNNAHKDR